MKDDILEAAVVIFMTACAMACCATAAGQSLTDAEQATVAEAQHDDATLAEKFASLETRLADAERRLTIANKQLYDDRKVLTNENARLNARAMYDHYFESPDGVKYRTLANKRLEKIRNDNSTVPIADWIFSTPAAKDHQCDCGPDCPCVGECHCEWPGQCTGKPRTAAQPAHSYRLGVQDATTHTPRVQAAPPSYEISPELDERLSRMEANTLRRMEKLGLTDTDEYRELQQTSKAARQGTSLRTERDSPAASPAIRWLDSTKAAYDECKATGKDALIYWSGETCPPCRDFERDILEDFNVERRLSEYVCVKLDAQKQSRKKLDTFGVTMMPTVQIIGPDWKAKSLITLKHTNNPDDFLRSLETQIIQPEPGTARRSVPVRNALWQTPIEDEAESEPLTSTLSQSESKQPTQWKARQTSGGSQGGWSGASRVVYVQAAPSYSYGGNGSQGGSYQASFRSAMGYGGAGSNGGAYGYSDAPRQSYYAPAYSASSYGSYYGGGSPVYCMDQYGNVVPCN